MITAFLVFVFILWMITDVLPSGSSGHTPNQQPQFHRKKPSISHLNPSTEISEEYDFDEADREQYETDRWHDHYGMSRQYVDDEHPLADSYDPEMGLTWDQYIDNQMSDD